MTRLGGQGPNIQTCPTDLFADAFIRKFFEKDKVADPAADPLDADVVSMSLKAVCGGGG